MLNNHETVTCSLKMAAASGKRVPLENLVVPAGKTATFFVLYSGGGTIVASPTTLEEAVAARDTAVAYWQRAPLPYGRVQVPDAGIQALIDSSIRNIWQAREIKKGLPAFQVGPTCYRGLWIVDGAFLLEAAAMLGAGEQARNGVAYELTNQKADGRIEVMPSYWKENGIVLWTCVRHAQLTQDKAWLESVWPKLERVAQYIKLLRKKTLENKSPLDDGLQPPGFPDGGIGGVQYEYTNIYWNLLGLKAFVQAARWLDKSEQAAAWQKEYDDFLATFRRAAARDMKIDPHGHRYLPIRMDGEDLPQRGQWGFCHGVYPGQLFAKDDPLLAGNMAMLEATEREGMVYGTGWDATGIWNYFASFYGHAWLWQGRGQKAARASLCLRQPRRAGARLARGAVAAWQAVQQSRRHAAQLGLGRIHPPGDPPHRIGSGRRIAPAGRHALPVARRRNDDAAQRRGHAFRPAPPDRASLERRSDGKARSATACRELQICRDPSARRQHSAD